MKTTSYGARWPGHSRINRAVTIAPAATDPDTFSLCLIQNRHLTELMARCREEVKPKHIELERKMDVSLVRLVLGALCQHMLEAHAMLCQMGHASLVSVSF